MNRLIYKVINRNNGKVYIGQTIGSLKERKKSHERAAKRGKDFLFGKALRKYGVDNFDWETVCDIEAPTDTLIEYLNIVEQMWIVELNTMNRNRGYNLTTGGSNGKPSEETKKKMSKAVKGEKNPMFGRTGKKAPSFGRTGEKHPMFGKKRPEHSLRMSGLNHPMYGKTKEKYSMFGKFGKNHPQWKGDNVSSQQLKRRKRKVAKREMNDDDYKEFMDLRKIETNKKISETLKSENKRG